MKVISGDNPITVAAIAAKRAGCQFRELTRSSTNCEEADVRRSCQNLYRFWASDALRKKKLLVSRVEGTRQYGRHDWRRRQ